MSGASGCVREEKIMNFGGREGFRRDDMVDSSADKTGGKPLEGAVAVEEATPKSIIWFTPGWLK